MPCVHTYIWLVFYAMLLTCSVCMYSPGLLRLSLRMCAKCVWETCAHTDVFAHTRTRAHTHTQHTYACTHTHNTCTCACTHTTHVHLHAHTQHTYACTHTHTTHVRVHAHTQHTYMYTHTHNTRTHACTHTRHTFAQAEKYGPFPIRDCLATVGIIGRLLPHYKGTFTWTSPPAFTPPH